MYLLNIVREINQHNIANKYPKNISKNATCDLYYAKFKAS